jgi:hypothetical protein
LPRHVGNTWPETRAPDCTATVALKQSDARELKPAGVDCDRFASGPGEQQAQSDDERHEHAPAPPASAEHRHADSFRESQCISYIMTMLMAVGASRSTHFTLAYHAPPGCHARVALVAQNSDLFYEVLFGAAKVGDVIVAVN